jgi:hypothetical protein
MSREISTVLGGNVRVSQNAGMLTSLGFGKHTQHDHLELTRAQWAAMISAALGTE